LLRIQAFPQLVNLLLLDSHLRLQALDLILRNGCWGRKKYRQYGSQDQPTGRRSHWFIWMPIPCAMAQNFV